MGIDAIMNNATTSLRAQRVAIEVTGENISNVNTPGYSRQRVIMQDGPVTTHNGFPLGNGVQIASVQRIYDSAVVRQINNGNSAFGNSDARTKSLQQLEPFFNEIAGNALGDAMQQFADSWQTLSQNPTGMAERQTVLGRATILTDTFHQLNDGVRTVQTFAENSLTGAATDITTAAKEIASLNLQIKQSLSANANANELMDRRDYLIQELSKKASVTYAEQSDGTVNINLQGGEALVSGLQYAMVYTNPVATTDPNLANPSSEIRISALGFPPSANTFTDANVTATIGGINNSLGEVGGLLQIRDTVLPGYLDKLDELAYNLAYQVNTQHAAGWNLNNVTGVAFFTPATAVVPPVTAATYKGYSSSSGIQVALTTTNEIAAADANPLLAGIGNNKNALLMAQLAGKTVSFSGGAQTTTASFYNTLVSGVGVDVQAAKNESDQNENFLRQLNNVQQSVSGVSLDEELTSLIKYQKAFEGASRVVNTATQMIDTLLNMIR